MTSGPRLNVIEVQFNQIETPKPIIRTIYKSQMTFKANLLNRDPIVILRINGENLLEFIDSPTFEPEIKSVEGIVISI